MARFGSDLARFGRIAPPLATKVARFLSNYDILVQLGLRLATIQR